MKVMTFTDGASRGNPGPASVGVLLLDQKGKKILEDYKYIGITTNNEAEYRALLLALDHAAVMNCDAVECFLDSELVVRQLNGQYKVKSEKMAALYEEVLARANRFQSIRFTHVRREHPNQKIVDRLANRALDERIKNG